MKQALLIAAFLSTIPAVCQTTPDAPVQTTVPVDGPLNPALPTVFIVGDSTARNKLDLGWGDHFAHFFDTTKINIANRAVAGRSSRSYLAEGKWAAALAQIKRGDFVLIQMGHNDGAGTPDSIQKDLKARNSLKGLGNETVEVTLPAKPVETVRTYGSYIRQYIAEARAKGATPILLTVTVRNIWKDGKIERDMGFRDFETQLSATEHVALIDMATCAADHFESLGPEKTALLFPIDHTHTSPEGAEINAACVVKALHDAKSPLDAYRQYRE